MKKLQNTIQKVVNGRSGMMHMQMTCGIPRTRALVRRRSPRSSPNMPVGVSVRFLRQQWQRRTQHIAGTRQAEEHRTQPCGAPKQAFRSAQTDVAEHIAARAAVMSTIEKTKILPAALTMHRLVHHRGSVRRQQRG